MEKHHSLSAGERSPRPRSPDDVHGMLLPRGWGQRSQAHHLCRVPERLLQVPPFDVPLKVCQAQHRQVQRVGGDARKAGPLFLRSNNPVIMWVGIVFVVLEVVTCGIWVWDCVGLHKHGEREVRSHFSDGEHETQLTQIQGNKSGKKLSGIIFTGT